MSVALQIFYNKSQSWINDIFDLMVALERKFMHHQNYYEINVCRNIHGNLSDSC